MMEIREGFDFFLEFAAKLNISFFFLQMIGHLLTKVLRIYSSKNYTEKKKKQNEDKIYSLSKKFVCTLKNL